MIIQLKNKNNQDFFVNTTCIHSIIPVIEVFEDKTSKIWYEIVMTPCKARYGFSYLIDEEMLNFMISALRGEY